MPDFWTVPREWPGETCYILAGGPSLRGFDAEVLRGRGRVIVINNSFLLAPWADVLYFGDRSWWLRHRDGALAAFCGRYRVSISTAEDGTFRLRNAGPRGLSRDPTALRSGSNSGYQAIGLAYLFGAARIVLLGYDMQINGMQTHWHDGHVGWTAAAQEKTLRDVFLPRFKQLVEPLASAGVEVLNATPGSALTCWPLRPLTELLVQ